MNRWYRRNAVVTRIIGKRLEKGVATEFWGISIVWWQREQRQIVEREGCMEGWVVDDDREP